MGLADAPDVLILGGGPAGQFEIHVQSSSAMVRSFHRTLDGKVIDAVSGTNVHCELTVAEDGAVHAVSLDNPGRVDIDLLTRWVDQKTGLTNVVNPSVVLNGKTNGIVEAWTALSKRDSRFAIRGSNNGPSLQVTRDAKQSEKDHRAGSLATQP